MPVSRLSQPYPFSLSIDKLELQVRLGVTPEEQVVPQTVHAWVKLYYPAVPNALQKDAADYQCYDRLCRKLRDIAAAQPVALVEFLLGELYRAIRDDVPEEVKIRIRLHKPLPEPLVGYTVDGATAEYTDLLEGLA